MAFPVVQTRATGVNGSNSSSHAITLPSGVAVGDLLLVVFSVDGNPTVTGTAGWTKLGQASNGTTVTSAVFWKIATGSDALTLTTSASEQSSHISLRISGARLLEGASANGSSVNSDPPNLAPTAGARDYLWIATRSGDAATAATAAPSGFTNLQTIAGGGQGATTNTAELTLNGASQNPATYTSATEQWVSWTLAAYALTAESTFTAAYQTLSGIPATLSVGYAILAADTAGAAWFALTTDGYSTWATYGAAALQVSSEFSAIYQVGGGVSATFSATYNAGDVVVGYDETWFPLLTGGAATWAGQTVAEGTGIIDGGGDLPIDASASFSASYTSATEVSNFRTAIYQIQSAVTTTFSAEYTADGSVAALYLASYNVAQSAVASFSADYEVFGIIGAVQSTYSALYRVFASASRAFSASYEVLDKEAVQSTFSATFNVVAAVESSLSSGYWVALEPVQTTFSAEYAVATFASDTYEAIYQVFTQPVATLVAEYNVATVSLADLVADVYRYGQLEVNR